MAIPSRQIGWSTTDNLLWQISKQLESLIRVTANTASALAYSDALSFPISYTSLRTQCDGSSVGNSIYTSETVNDISELVALFNSNTEARILGRFSALGDDILVLTTTTDIKNVLCPTGTLTLYVFSD